MIRQNDSIKYSIEEVRWYAEFYLSLGWNIVPIKFGTKQPITKWSDFTQTRQTFAYLETADWQEWKKNINIAIVCGSISSLMVVDCDSEETARWFEEIFIHLSNTYKVKTRRGMHYYYRIVQSKIETLKFDFETDNVDVKIDIKGDKSLITAPPSVFIWKDEQTKEEESFQYQPITSIEDLLELNEDEYRELIKTLRKFQDEYSKKEEEIREDEETEKGIERYRINETRLIDFLKEIYKEGVRNDIVMYVSGFLKKAGYTLDETEEFCKKLWELVEEDEYKARIAVIRHTYKKDNSKLKGWQGLLELCQGNEELIKKLRETVAKRGNYTLITDDGVLFTVKNWKVYENKTITQTISLEDGSVKRIRTNKIISVGPAFVIKKKLKYKNKVSYLIQTRDLEAVFETIEPKTVELSSGDIIEESKAWRKYARTVIHTMKYPTVHVVSTTGWHEIEEKLVFAHPGIENRIPVELHKEHPLHRYQPNIDDQYLCTIKDIIEEGRLLGVALVISLSAPLLELLGKESFTVFFTGAPETGKTTAHKIACSLYYNASKHYFTADSTKTAMEISMNQLKNLPIVFDELGANTKLDLQSLALTISTNKGRSRSTKDLSVNIKDIHNVAFFSTEALNLNEFSRAGALRRMFVANVRVKQDLTEMDISNIISYHGAGIEWLKFIKEQYENRDKNESVWNNAVEYGIKKTKEKGWGGIVYMQTLYTTLYLLQLSGFNIENVQNTIEDIVEEHYGLYTKKRNIILQFCKHLAEDIVSNQYCYYVIESDGQGENINLNIKTGYGEKKGEIDMSGQKNILLFYTHAFSKAIEEWGMTEQNVLKELSENRILIKSSSNKYRSAKYSKVAKNTISCYVIDIDKVFAIASEITEEI